MVSFMFLQQLKMLSFRNIDLQAKADLLDKLNQANNAPA